MHHPQHDKPVLDYLSRLYDEGRGEHACRATDPAGLLAWQERARPVLRRLIGLESIASDAGGTTPVVELGPAEELDGYARRRGTVVSEPGWSTPFWFLRPAGNGPFPLAVTPHGHDPHGPDTSVGYAHDEAHAAKIAAEERDVAVQAVRRGFATIAPAARGTSTTCIPDINGRHDNRNCRSQLIHALFAGRTAIGERVWDLSRLIDWAECRSDIDTATVLVTGNSGGGVITTYAAAVDPRITIAIPSCSYCSLVSEGGLVHHCDCNTVPGILRFGEVWDIAALIAPRYLCIVNGKQDSLFPLHEVERAVAGVTRAYEAAGVPERIAHVYGPAGHRFYADLMWPFVEAALARSV